MQRLLSKLIHSDRETAAYLVLPLISTCDHSNPKVFMTARRLYNLCSDGHVQCSPLSSNAPKDSPNGVLIFENMLKEEGLRTRIKFHHTNNYLCFTKNGTLVERKVSPKNWTTPPLKMANALLLLNMVLSFTLATSVTDYPCILPFFKLVPEYSEKYLVSMQTFDPGPCYVQVKHIQMMVFAVNHSSTLECPIRKFHQPFDIIVTYLNNQTFNTFITFFKFSMHPSTLFIFIVKQGENETESLSHFRNVQLQLPAMKLLMVIKPDKSVALRKLCCGYCKDEFLKNPNINLSNIVALHKTTFWNGNEKEIKAVIYNHRSDYFKNYANDLYACSRKVSKSEYCASGIMSAIYISHLHNISLKILNAVDSNQLSKFLQVMVFSSSHNQMLERPLRKFYQPFNIIITYLNNQAGNSISTFFKYSMHPSTLFIFLIQQGDNETKSLELLRKVQLQLPAMKLVTKLNKSGGFRTLCYGYCKEELEVNSNPSSLNIIAMHKTTFWNGNGNQIKAIIRNRRSDYFQNYAHDLYACSRMVSKSEYCTTGIMSAIYVSSVHNISLEIINGADTYQWSRVNFHLFDQYIRSSTQYLNYDFINYHHLTGIALPVEFYSKQFIYCGQENSNFYIDFQNWISPFPLTAWLMLISLFCCNILISSWLENFDNTSPIRVCIETLALIIGENPAVNGTLFVKKRFSFMMSIFGMAFCQLYGNVITSCTTVSFYSKPFANLNELLDSSYKILWYSYFEPHPSHTKDKVEFERAGLLDRLEDSYYEIRGNNMSIETHSFYFKNEHLKNYAILEDSANVDTFQAAIQTTINSGLGGKSESRCHIIEQKLCSGVNVWELYSMNRYWIMETLLRLQDSGLSEKWESWSVWILRLKGRYWVSPKHYRSDFIVLSQIVPVIILWASLSGIAFGVFLFEFRE
ncbi:unnamed protein product [Orchesella dallaii]|uniref:Uncharacterized protein n=1 Tax=Orchesella dallaii TaxID=48710 RepID=A0ABP1S511_9HEXA